MSYENSWQACQLKTMYCPSRKHSEMNKENEIANKSEQPNLRVTRARAKALGASGGLPPLKPLGVKDQKKGVQPDSKRAVTDGNNSNADDTACPQRKKRAVLKDITNTSRNNSNIKCIKGGRVQDNNGFKELPKVPVNPQVQEGGRTCNNEHTTKESMQELQKLSTVLGNVEETSAKQSTRIQGHGLSDLMVEKQTSSIHAQQGSSSGREVVPDGLKEAPGGKHVADIDANQKDPQMCGTYAYDIYTNLRVKELDRRPSVNYMEILQREITHVMRGILIDWLVEVSDEYMLAPDTLYMTVNLIDRFLSRNYIEKQRLQLLGITCMLIASKYEEICAPRVEEFCFITDNTYKKEEVLHMESQVLSFLEFQLSVPTTKKFLRRFIQAAQSSYKVPRIEMEFLANYLAELTLTEYSFLKFLPSLIAASAVFLAKWILDQSDHPWNKMLEHYTSYKVSDMKPAVLGLQQLICNANTSPLKAVHEKYKQAKFKCVATLSSPEPVESAF